MRNVLGLARAEPLGEPRSVGPSKRHRIVETGILPKADQRLLDKMQTRPGLAPCVSTAVGP
jgi:hypothetical protein